MEERRTFRGFPLAGVAAAGVVLGHWLAYSIAVPRPRLRAEFLLDSGHGYWSIAVRLGVVLGLSGLGALSIRRLSGSLSPGSSGGQTLSWLALRLALLQMVAFSAMEVSERLLSGVPVAALLQHHVFLIGLLIQLLVACAGALVLVVFSSAVARVACSLRRAVRLRPIELRLVLLPEPIRPVPVLSGASTVRGPPSRSKRAQA